MKRAVKPEHGQDRRLDADEMARLRFVAHEAVRFAMAALRAEPPAREYFRPRDVALRLGWTVAGFSNRVSQGYFGKAEGVRRIGKRRVLIHWPTFEATVLNGDWKPKRWVRWRRIHGIK